LPGQRSRQELALLRSASESTPEQASQRLATLGSISSELRPQSCQLPSRDHSQTDLH
jgi:hypothetical protein